jgi:hypothetical protein
MARDCRGRFTKYLSEQEGKTRYRASTLIKVYKKYDKKNGYHSNLTIDYLIDNIFNKKCTYCHTTENLGCDRVDNNKGHTTDNVVPACGRCNITRLNNFTVDEMKQIGLMVQFIEKKRTTNYINQNNDSTSITGNRLE